MSIAESVELSRLELRYVIFFLPSILSEIVSSLYSYSGLILHEKLNYRNEGFPVVNFYREKSAVSPSITPRDTLEVLPVKIPGVVGRKWGKGKRRGLIP